MLQNLPIALAQVKAGNTSENLLNNIRKIMYSLCQEKEITKKVYNNIMNSVNLSNRMNPVFLNLRIVMHLILTDYYYIFWIE